MSEQLYRQVTMRSTDGRVETAWIPTQFAKAGRVIEIKDHGEWRVLEAYEGTKTADAAEHRAVTRRFNEVLDKPGRP